MESIRHQYSVLYQFFSEIPELTRFRRYLDSWSWILYNGSWNIDHQRKDIDRLIAEIHGVPSKGCVFTVTDYHRAYANDENEFLKTKIEAYENSVRRYSKDLLMAHAVANLPVPSEFHTQYFLRNYRSSSFDGDVFGPTKEDAGVYTQIPVHPDLASLRDFGGQDPLTAFVIRNIDSMMTSFWYLIHKVLRREGEPVSYRKDIPFETIMLGMDLLTAIYVPVLFVGGMGILSCIKSEATNIVVLGVICLWLTISLVLWVPGLKRGDIFAVGAAFCAVGGIFIGTKSMNN